MAPLGPLAPPRADGQRDEAAEMRCGASPSAPGQIYDLMRPARTTVPASGERGEAAEGVTERGTELEPDEAAVATW